MSIESSLVKLADKIDAQGASDVKPDYKNPNQSIEKSLERIANQMDKQGKSDVVPEYKNPNQSIEKSMERIAEHYTSGGSGGDETFDILFNIDENQDVQLVHGSYSDIDFESDTPPSVGVIVENDGMKASGAINIYSPDQDSVTFYAGLLNYGTWSYVLITLYSDDSVTIEPAEAPPLDIKHAFLDNAGQNEFDVQFVWYESRTGRFDIVKDTLYPNAQIDIIVPSYIKLLDTNTGLSIEAYKIDAVDLSYSDTFDAWLFTKFTSVEYDPDAPTPV